MNEISLLFCVNVWIDGKLLSKHQYNVQEGLKLMPRKVSKTDKPALQFLERPVCGARLRDVPEVRAALNAKDFFSETQKQNSSTLNTWVNPQFDSSVTAAPAVRRGRRKCQSATSILDKCSQVSRKNSVCKFPSLSFQTVTRDKSQKLKSTSTKKGAESTELSKAGTQPERSCQRKRMTLSAHCTDVPKRQLATIRKEKAKTVSERAASHIKCSDQPGIQSTKVANRARIPPEGASTPASTEVSSVSPPPDVDALKIMQGEGGCPSSPFVHLLLSRTPPCNEPPDILVADTPERDYGLKVTWRRRKSLMVMLKKKGYISESDALIHS